MLYRFFVRHQRKHKGYLQCDEARYNKYEGRYYRIKRKEHLPFRALPSRPHYFPIDLGRQAGESAKVVCQKGRPPNRVFPVSQLVLVLLKVLALALCCRQA